ncbi:MAG: hypothetical protein SFY80_05620 [Verrucomicrobiota bacterium]|nr:hypothetical protein [Verrucomicrobiota bacterium]
MSKLWRVIKLVGINLIVLLLGLVALELILGGWLHPSRIYMVGIERDVVKDTKLEGLYEWPGGTIRYSRDHWGFRSAPANPSEIDVLTVGGSTTEQRYLNDGFTWQDVCARELAKQPQPLKLANAGIDGQSTFGHIKNLSWWFSKVPNLKPRFILYYVGINDFIKQEPDKFDEMAIRGGTAMDFIQENSALLRGWRLIHGNYQASQNVDVTHHKLEIKPEQWVPNPIHGTDYEALMKTHLDGYEARLRQLVTATRDFGSEPILVTQPTWWYRRDRGQLEVLFHGFHYGKVFCTGMDFYYMMGLLNSRTLQVAREMNCLAFDLEAEVNFTDGDMYDYGHYTPAGAERVGKYLAMKLTQAKLVGNAGPN